MLLTRKLTRPGCKVTGQTDPVTAVELFRSNPSCHRARTDGLVGSQFAIVFIGHRGDTTIRRTLAEPNLSIGYCSMEMKTRPTPSELLPARAFFTRRLIANSWGFKQLAFGWSIANEHPT
jgi:hypothetical protein